MTDTGPGVAVGGMSRRVTAIVGRDLERAWLADEIDAAIAGTGRVVLLSGEAGIGKTTLATDVIDRAGDRVVRAAWGASWDGDGAPVFWPWTQVMRSLTGHETGTEALSSLGPRASDLRHLLPELGSPSGDSPADADARFRLFDAIGLFLSAVARANPLVVVLDDLHWADATSIELLRFIARTIHGVPVLAIGTYRHNEAARAPNLVDLVAQVERDGRHLHLVGLDDVGVAALTGTDAAAAGELRQQSGGNPFFIQELVRLGDGRDLPTGVRSVLVRRLRNLGAGTNEALRWVAVLGSARRDVLEAAGVPRAQLAAAVDEAARAEVLRTDVGAPQFVHALFREVVLESMTAAELGHRHGALGEALERTGGPAASVHEVAHHFWHEAQSGGDRRRAAAWCCRAGDLALGSLGFAEAEERYAQALELIDPANRTDRYDLLLAVAEARRYGGLLDAAKRAFLDALSIARQLDDADMFGQAALRLAQRGGPIPLFFVFGESDTIAALEEALERVPDDDSALRARLLAQLANDLTIPTPTTPRDIVAMLDEAAAMAERVDDPVARYLASFARHNLWQSWEAPPDLSWQHVVELGAALGGVYQVATLMLAAYAQVSVGDVRAGDAYWEDARAVAADVGLRSVEPVLVLYRGVRLHMEGDLDAAGSAAEEVRGLLRITGDRFIAGQRGALAFLLARDRDQVPHPEATRRRAEMFPMPAMYAALALGLAERGDHGGAAVELRRVLGGDPPTAPPQDSNRAVWWFLCAQVSHALGDADAADWLYEEGSTYPGHYIRAGFGGVYGAADLASGLLAQTVGNIDVAVRHLEDAVRLNDVLPSRPFAARSRLALARVLLERNASGDPAHAERLAAEAHEAATRMGMAAVVAEAEALLPDLASTTPMDMTLPADRGVFRRDGDVWLVAYGGTSTRLRHTKGMDDLAVLLARPGREVHVAELMGVTVDTRGSSSDVTLDRASIDALRHRLADLEDDETAAVAAGDSERAARAVAERDAIVERLSADLGLGGRARRLPDPVERARKAVQTRLATTVKRLERDLPPLGRHLRACLRTGTFCAYDPPEPVDWDLHP